MMIRELYKNIFTKRWVQSSNIFVAEDWLAWVNKALNEDIDIIIMDYNMPILNWEDATRKIRTNNKEVTIILSSAWWKELEKISMDIFDWNLPKPISNNYIDTIADYFKTKTWVQIEFE